MRGAGGRVLLPLLVVVSLSLSDCGGNRGAAPAGMAAASPKTAAAGTVRASALTRDHLLNRATLGPWWGSGCPRSGDCGCGSAGTMAEEFTCQMNELRANDIPVSVYLFDGSGWSARDSRNDGVCEGDDCCSWNLGDDIINRLADEHVRALVHFWGGCHNTEQYARVHAQLGGSLLGFYLDDGSSDQELQRVNDFMRSVSPGDFENIAKTHQSHEPSTTDAGLSKMANVAYVSDLANDFTGLRDGITRLLEKTRLLPAPTNELTAYDYENRVPPDEETFYRRIHFGAFQPVMAHTPFANSDPWRSEYSGDLLIAYRYWAWLHKELTPYFLSYTRRMFEQPDQPVIQPGAAPFSMRVGEEIFVPFVTDRTTSVNTTLPSGQWVDYWDETRVVSGALTDTPAPPGREPVFLRLGALIPMEVERNYTGHGTVESQGSLTVLVYPSGTSTFRYNNDDTGQWTTFKSVATSDKLTLSADSFPGRPILYRVGRMSSRPKTITVNGLTVLVNQSGDLPEMENENEVNESEVSAWFYDEGAHRLIVKVVP
jgi:hypothetical protein